ncbi:MAG: hypothetical protein KH509_06585 [Clostridium sp.]|nr:hypothetical protein [Clostridium sp.]
MLYAVMEVESGYKVDAQNGSCYGLMQIHTINMEYLSSISEPPTSPTQSKTSKQGHLSRVHY